MHKNEIEALQINVEYKKYFEEHGVVLVPNKYLFLIPQYKGINKYKAIYRMQRRHLQSCLSFLKNEGQRIAFLGIIYPSGRIVMKPLAQTKQDHNVKTVGFLVKKKKDIEIKINLNSLRMKEMKGE